VVDVPLQGILAYQTLGQCNFLTNQQVQFFGSHVSMDTNQLDKQSKQHLTFYYNVLTGAKICIVLITITLVLMAIFLV